MPYSKKGWTDSWEFDFDLEDEDEQQVVEFKLQVAPAIPEDEAPHAFIATLTIARFEQVREPNTPDNWEPRNPKLIHRSEHPSIADGITAVREAAERAELIRKGPDNEW